MKGHIFVVAILISIAFGCHKTTHTNASEVPTLEKCTCGAQVYKFAHDSSLVAIPNLFTIFSEYNGHGLHITVYGVDSCTYTVTDMFNNVIGTFDTIQQWNGTLLTGGGPVADVGFGRYTLSIHLRLKNGTDTTVTASTCEILDCLIEKLKVGDCYYEQQFTGNRYDSTVQVVKPTKVCQ